MTRTSLMRAAAAALFLLAASARALTLGEAAGLALQNDPRLRAAQQEVQSSTAEVDLARAGYLPNASLNAGTGLTRYYLPPQISGLFPLPGTLNPTSASIKASQPLYSGGRTVAEVASSRSQLEGARQNAIATRQQLLLATATAYLDVVRDRSIIESNDANVAALQQELSDTEKRFAAGEATRTDIAQAAARLAEAQANVKRAQANAHVSEASLSRLIGAAPGELAQDWPAPAVPGSLAEALAAAGMTPAALAADAQRRSAQAQIDAARADYWPRLSLDGQATAQDDSKFAGDRYQDWSVQLKATLPFYEGGATRARVDAAKAQAAAAEATADDTRRAAAESIEQAWAQFQAADEVIRAYEAEVEAATLALDDVHKELDAGTRTTRDLLDAARDKLSAQVSLATSRRDRAVAAFQLLAACGKLRLEDVR